MALAGQQVLPWMWDAHEDSVGVRVSFEGRHGTVAKDTARRAHGRAKSPNSADDIHPMQRSEYLNRIVL